MEAFAPLPTKTKQLAKRKKICVQLMAIWLRYFAFGAFKKFFFGALQIFVTILVRLAFLWTVEVAKRTFFL